jgi:two-component system alkaline phosphatase synthesis response regulator PhoP
MSYTVLVIDDTRKVVEIIKFILEQEGYRVLTATDPYEGIRLAQSKPVDLILLDIMMPLMDGYQVFEILKREERTKDIPVIMLTARAIIMITPRDFFYGLYGFIAKPFTKRELLEVVRNVLSLTTMSKTTKLIQPLGIGEEEEFRDEPLRGPG